jgi:arylsulfatase B
MEKFDHIEDIQRRIFAAMLANLDDSVGEILDKLHEEGLEGDTMLYFISDNGGPTKELTSSNLPLRDGKSSMYEGGVRVPFLLQWPGNLRGGSIYERPVSTVDIFATTFAAAGLDLPGGSDLDSVNILPYIRDGREGSPHNTLYWRQGQKAGLRQGDMKIVKMSRKGNWELYDLSKDLSEEHNLAGDQPALLDKLVKTWEQLDSEMVEAAF